MSQRKIDLTQLQPEQLVEFQKSTQQEIDHFTQSLHALQTANTKLKQCIKSVDRMSSGENSELLVPLTSSLYVPGKAIDKDEYLVDIGTGYFVGKLAKDAKVVYENKIKKLTEDSAKLKDIIVQKNDIMNSINMVLRSKVQGQRESG